MCLTTSISTASATNRPTRQLLRPRPDPPWVTLLILKASITLLHLMRPPQSLITPIPPHHPLPTNLTPNQYQPPTLLPPPRVDHASPCRSKPPSLSHILRAGDKRSRPTLHPLLANMLLALPHWTAHTTQKSQGRNKVGTPHHHLQPSRLMVIQQRIRQALVVFRCQAGYRDHQERKDKSRTTKLVRWEFSSDRVLNSTLDTWT